MENNYNHFSKLVMDEKKYSLIICEKQSVASRISQVLGSNQVNKIKINNNIIYKIIF